jgi:hypothetical protein
VDLPVMPPVLPMLAKSVKASSVFTGPDPEKFGGLSFEPKWDRFCVWSLSEPALEGVAD